MTILFRAILDDRRMFDTIRNLHELKTKESLYPVDSAYYDNHNSNQKGEGKPDTGCSQVVCWDINNNDVQNS
jgi:hypothetical protein